MSGRQNQRTGSTDCGKLHVTPDTSLETLYALMDKVLKKAPLKEFGVRESDLAQFAKDVIQTQQRLLRNNYVELTEEQILEITVRHFKS